MRQHHSLSREFPAGSRLHSAHCSLERRGGSFDALLAGLRLPYPCHVVARTASNARVWGLCRPLSSHLSMTTRCRCLQWCSLGTVRHSDSWASRWRQRWLCALPINRGHRALINGVLQTPLSAVARDVARARLALHNPSKSESLLPRHRPTSGRRQFAQVFCCRCVVWKRGELLIACRVGWWCRIFHVCLLQQVGVS